VDKATFKSFTVCEGCGALCPTWDMPIKALADCRCPGCQGTLGFYTFDHNQPALHDAMNALRVAVADVL
jgi:hypothetical protein